MNPPPLDVKQAWTSRELKHDRQLFSARFSPDGRYVAAAGQEGLVLLWDLESGEQTTLGAHDTWVSSLAFDPVAKRLFTADYHGLISCWGYGEAAADKEAPQWSIPNADRDCVRALAVTPDGRQLVSAGDDAKIKVWDLAHGGKIISELEGHRECVFSLAISPDGAHLVSGDLLGAIRDWNIREGWKPGREFDASLLHTRKADFLADVGGVRSLAFSPDGKILAAGGMKDAKSNAFCPGKPTVLVFDWSSGAPTAELGIAGKSDGPFNALRFLDDKILTGHTELLHSPSELTFWKIGQPGQLHSIKNHSAYDLSLHPDGRQLLAPCYVSGGSTGNGARGHGHDDYSPNGTVLRIFSLFAKPAEAKS